MSGHRALAVAAAVFAACEAPATGTLERGVVYELVRQERLADGSWVAEVSPVGAASGEEAPLRARVTTRISTDGWNPCFYVHSRTGAIVPCGHDGKPLATPPTEGAANTATAPPSAPP